MKQSLCKETKMLYLFSVCAAFVQTHKRLTISNYELVSEKD